MNTATKVILLCVAVFICFFSLILFFDKKDGLGEVSNGDSKTEVRHKKTKVTRGKKRIRKKEPEDISVLDKPNNPKQVSPREYWQRLFEEAAKKPIDLTPSKNKVFRTGTEQIMAWIFTTELGAMPPPLPKIPVFDEAHMAEILSSPNSILLEDDEKVAIAKQNVEFAKKELIEYIEDGGTIERFFEYYHGELVKAHHEWVDCQQSVIKVIREEPEIAVDYINAVNARLAQKGIRSVKIPPPMLKSLNLDENN